MEMTYEKYLIGRAAEKHVPLNASLELLPLCNMNCDMCYVRLSREEMEEQGSLRRADEWLTLAEQMRKAGTLFVLLTGGDLSGLVVLVEILDIGDGILQLQLQKFLRI